MHSLHNNLVIVFVCLLYILEAVIVTLAKKICLQFSITIFFSRHLPFHRNFQHFFPDRELQHFYVRSKLHSYHSHHSMLVNVWEHRIHTYQMLKKPIPKRPVTRAVWEKPDTRKFSIGIKAFAQCAQSKIFSIGWNHAFGMAFLSYQWIWESLEWSRFSCVLLKRNGESSQPRMLVCLLWRMSRDAVERRRSCSRIVRIPLEYWKIFCRIISNKFSSNNVPLPGQ